MSAAEIAIHEFGHSLGNLADEYDYGGPPTYTGGEPGAPNASKLTSAAMQSAGTKWAAWLGFDDPAYDGLVSTFEGCNHSELGIYRPSNNSKMRALGRPFNHPSAESLIIEIYKMVNPIDSSTPTGATLNGSEIVFVDPVDPVGNPLSITWKLDGIPLADAVGETIELTTLPVPPGSHVLSVTVQDTSLLVRNEVMRNTWMTRTLNWNMVVPQEPGDIDCDGLTTATDGNALALALTDPDGFAITYPSCPLSQADVNADLVLDGADIATFLQMLVP